MLIRNCILQGAMSLFLLLTANSTVYAHPHNWITLHSRFVLDDDAQLQEINQTWEFDFYYSLMMHADLLSEFGSETVGLPATAQDMIQNLADYDYFSSLKLDGIPVDLGMPVRYELSTKRVEGQLILELNMSFDISSSVVIENKRLTWQVFDPTYYIAMNHDSEKSIEIVGGNATECSRSLETPNPSDELIEYAMNLDRNRKDTVGLGAHFAETITIQCI